MKIKKSSYETVRAGKPFGRVIAVILLKAERFNVKNRTIKTDLGELRRFFAFPRGKTR